jgi:protein-S-isoprenylcysteine O-methyltransferase Ste14
MITRREGEDFTADGGSVARGAIPAEPPTAWRRLARAASNLGLAALFFLGVVPAALHYGSDAADYIWAVGAGLMGLLALVRPPPKTSMVTASSITATAGMMLVPGTMRLAPTSAGAVYVAAIAVELAAVIITQFGRLYLGRRFALLPANRGIVASGPFRVVRHPVYAGWLLLMTGFAMAHPSARNAIAVVLAMPFMVWRIAQEEALLGRDPDYRAYMERTRFRLIPWLI